MNSLSKESSPYLLQHAGNPVDWHPWSVEAFEQARIEDKPVFLSVGYSTCHWCHVMAHESFEDVEIAGMMNMTFVNIKVDREERPDIDSIYMKVCQAMTGSGGWPLSIIMTPDKKPFFAGTYFPKTSMYGRIGMKDLIQRLNHSWKHDREKILDSAEKVVNWLNKDTIYSSSDVPGISALEQAFSELSAMYDPVDGGFTVAPKFPTPQNLTFLLRHFKRFGDEKALDMVEKTLDKMRFGGIYDHIGFGFHRYSTDAAWFLPHFEKMLYDQAFVSMAFIEAFQATGKTRYENTAREIIAYVSRDLKSDTGPFFSAEDADSEGIEGAFYLWTEDQIRRILGNDEADVFIRSYGVRPEGNFHEEASHNKVAGNILHLAKPLSEIADELGMADNILAETLEKSRKKLFSVRVNRIRPHLDDKIMTDWNGLMIASLAKAARAFDDEAFLRSASTAADFFLSEMLNPDGSILHSFRGKPSSIPGFLNDYAFMAWGLIELYQAGFDIRYLKSAIELSEYMIEHFEDKISGGFFLSSDRHEDILVRIKDFYDGALPSGNSVAAFNLIRLGRLTANPVFEEKARKVLMALGTQLEYQASAYAQFLSCIDFEVGPSFEVVIAGRAENEDTKEIIRALNSKFLPNMTVLLANQDEPSYSFLTSIAPFVKDMKGINGRATAYICSGQTCQEPVTEISRLLELLD